MTGISDQSVIFHQVLAGLLLNPGPGGNLIFFFLQSFPQKMGVVFCLAIFSRLQVGVVVVFGCFFEE